MTTDQRPSPDEDQHGGNDAQALTRSGGSPERSPSPSLAALFALPALAQAALLKNFTAEVRDQNGNPYTQAGGHPFEAFTDINFVTHDGGTGQQVPDESVRTVNVDLPAGLVGNPQNTPQCTHAQLTTGFGGGCPANTQVGVTVLKTGLGQNFVSAVYNLKPPTGRAGAVRLHRPDPARLHQRLGAQRRRAFGDHPQHLPGAAADRHQPHLLGRARRPRPRRRARAVPQRPRPDGGLPVPGPGVAVPYQPDLVHGPGDYQACTPPRGRTARSRIATRRRPVGATGCNAVPFDPSVDVQSGSQSSDSPGSLSVDVDLPQPQNPTGITAVEPEEGRGHPARGHLDQPLGRRRPRRLHPVAVRGRKQRRPAAARPPRRSATSRSPARCSPIRCRARSIRRPPTRTRSAACSRSTSSPRAAA